MSTPTDLEALKNTLRQETKDFVDSLEQQLKTSAETLLTEARKRLLADYEHMKEISERSDKEAFEFFDKNMELLGPEHLKDAEKILRQQLGLNRKTLEHFKTRFLD